MQRQRSSYSIVPILAFSLLACSGPTRGVSSIQLSYEAIPGTGVALGQGAVDMSASTYADKLAFTQEIHTNLVPAIFAEFGLDFSALTSESGPGGYRIETNPSMQTRGSLSAQEATQVAAGLGYVMYQWSVLVTDFTAKDGNTGYAIVQFDNGVLDSTMAQAFFAHAASVHDGLGGGYMSFADQMIFLNLRGTDGTPSSGLDDQAFFAQLGNATASFKDATTELSKSGFADAWQVENNWESAPDGADYLSLVSASGASIEALNSLQTQFNQQLLQAAKVHGWETLAGTRPNATRQVNVFRHHRAMSLPPKWSISARSIGPSARSHL